jgi:hypothetical protein
MRGLMFKPEMTLANLEGRKSRTSRVYGLKEINQNPDNWNFVYEELGTFYFEPKDKHCIVRMIKCPYGHVGSELFGAETYCHKADSVTGIVSETEFWYRASTPYVMKIDGDGGCAFRKDGYEASPWESAMLMPEKASRYHVILTKIICQRINDISPEDCIKEGIEPNPQTSGYINYLHKEGSMKLHHNIPLDCNSLCPTDSFITLWDKVNLKTGHGWDKNEWVWGLYYDVKLKCKTEVQHV